MPGSLVAIPHHPIWTAQLVRTRHLIHRNPGSEQCNAHVTDRVMMAGVKAWSHTRGSRIRGRIARLERAPLLPSFQGQNRPQVSSISFIGLRPDAHTSLQTHILSSDLPSVYAPPKPRLHPASNAPHLASDAHISIFDTHALRPAFNYPQSKPSPTGRVSTSTTNTPSSGADLRAYIHLGTHISTFAAHEVFPEAHHTFGPPTRSEARTARIPTHIISLDRVYPPSKRRLNLQARVYPPSGFPPQVLTHISTYTLFSALPPPNYSAYIHLRRAYSARNAHFPPRTRFYRPPSNVLAPCLLPDRIATWQDERCCAGARAHNSPHTLEAPSVHSRGQCISAAPPTPSIGFHATCRARHWRLQTRVFISGFTACKRRLDRLIDPALQRLRRRLAAC
ncbi:hypothetical protein DFH09DRAFT_1389898 [Mycena vulgaris]|nr:hypothetical protein DFH09DRAFT_1389898 [Mycena vulgaris]